jgi:hypothetical protein
MKINLSLSGMELQFFGRPTRSLYGQNELGLFSNANIFIRIAQDWRRMGLMFFSVLSQVNAERNRLCIFYTNRMHLKDMAQ